MKRTGLSAMNFDVATALKQQMKTIGPAGLRDFANPAENFNGKVILVTGGTGSFGKQFVRQIIENYEPKKLIIFSRDEQKHYRLSQKYSPEDYPFLRYFIGDVRDRERLDLALRDVDYVVHAAALKHVPIAEYNPFECIRTNVLGAENIVQTAIKRGVRRVIALSTDKASNPVNLYGASKLAADKIFVAANNLSGDDGCRFSVVRYGNVLGSDGSAAQLFAELRDGSDDPIPITDCRMTRFWITQRQAVNFVFSSFSLMQGGEIFIPKIPSMKITDFANVIAPGRPHKMVGIRPGEKLHEVMISEDESRTAHELADRYVILPAFAWWGRENSMENSLGKVAEGFRYASEDNDEWLSPEALQVMLADMN